MKSIITKLICTECMSEFNVNLSHYKDLGFSTLPKSCPICLDKAKNTTGKITKVREELFYYPNVKIAFDKINFKNNKRNANYDEKDSYHFHYDGSMINWRYASTGLKGGSLTFYSLKQYKQGDNVSFRHMKAIIEENLMNEIRTREYEYIYLGEPDMNANEMVLDSVISLFKTTFKGFSADVDDRNEIPENAIWKRNFYKGYRSGRARADEDWFIVNPHAKMIEIHDEDEEYPKRIRRKKRKEDEIC